MGRIIEAKAVISGEDRTGKMFDSIAKRSKEFGKNLKASANLGNLGKQIDQFRKAQGSFAQARTHFRASQVEVGRLAKELDGARRSAAAFDGIKSFSKNGTIAKEIGAARKLVADLDRQFATAQRTVQASSEHYERHAAAVKASRRELETAGVATKRLAVEQRRLEAQAQVAARRASASGDMLAGMGVAGAAGSRAAARMSDSRRMIDGMGVSGRALAAKRIEAEEANRLRRDERYDAGRTLAGMGGLYVGHKVKEGTRATLHTYREFDKYKRQTQAFGNFSDGEMGQIVDMAIHGGATTRYNDIQWLQGAKALGGRGVKAGSVMGILPEAAQYGQAMSTDLPEAVAGLEGSLFAFRRDLSTPEKATAAARRTADLQVNAAKAFGLSHHDLKGGYEYGALGAEMSGLGEEKLLAFLGLGKKLNIDGISQGNAWRAMVSDFLAPTRKAKEALAGVGVDYSKFQKMPERLSVENFENMIAQQYGVKLNKGARAKLDTAFSNKDVFQSPSAFAVAVKDALKGQVGISGAKDANKVAGSAERFRQNNVEKVDANALMDALMEQMKGGNLALATAIFGEKQASRVMAALRDGDVWQEALSKVLTTPEGKAKGVADKMNAGFDGAAARFEGAVKNLETAMGRSWDDDGKGGFLTGLADAAAHATQALAELPKPALQAGSALLYAGGKVATASGTLALVGAAFSLKGAATALTAAAVRLGAPKPSDFVKGVAPVAAATAGGAAASAAGGAAAGAAGGALSGFATGTILGGGALVGAYLGDAMPKAMGSGENFGDSIKSLADLQRRLEVGAAAAKALGYGRPNGSVSMPDAAVASAGFPSSWQQSRGGWGISDFLNGPEKVTRTLPLPPSMGRGDLNRIDPSGQLQSQTNTLDRAATASATAANGGQPIEATVKPDQITARIDSIPPVTGEATVQVDNRLNVVVTVNEAMFNAKVEAAAGRATARIPLANGGARPGAVSMPGAATTPGAAPAAGGGQ